MTITITVRLTDEQADKISRSGLSKSEYTRQAIDYYSENKYRASVLSKVNIVEECITLLQGYRDDLKNQIVSDAYQNLQLSYKIEENVRQNDENLSYKNEENVKKIYKNEENVRQVVIQNEDDLSYKNKENVRQIGKSALYEIYKPYLETMSRMLNTQNGVPDHFKKKITVETNTKPTQLNDFLFKYREDIMSMEWSYPTEVTHVKYEDGKKS